MIKCLILISTLVKQKPQSTALCGFAGNPRFGGGVGIEPTSVYLQIFIWYGFRLIAMTLLPGLPP